MQIYLWNKKVSISTLGRTNPFNLNPEIISKAEPQMIWYDVSRRIPFIFGKKKEMDLVHSCRGLNEPKFEAPHET